MRHSFMIALAAVTALLSACASNPVPDGYVGPLARVSDSALANSATENDIFFVAEVDGSSIPQSYSATASANRGRGFLTTPEVVSRDIPAQRQTVFTLVGKSHRGAPIAQLVSTIYLVQGSIAFVPVANHSYTVKGQLGPTYSAVWMEDDATHQILDHKIEVNGKSTAGFFEK